MNCDLFLSSWFGKPCGPTFNNIPWTTKHTLRVLGYHTTPVPLLCPCHRYTALLDVKIKCSNICTHLILTAFNYQGPSILPFSWCQVTWISFTQIRLFQKTSTKPALHLFSCNSCNKENYWKLISVRKSQFF